MNVFIPLCLESNTQTSLTRGKDPYSERNVLCSCCHIHTPCATGQKHKPECTLRQRGSPAELVEHSDVSIHVVDVVGVGGVLDDVPLLWFGALRAEHVTTVLGLIVYTVETCHLHSRRRTVCYTGNKGLSGVSFVSINDFIPLLPHC